MIRNLTLHKHYAMYGTGDAAWSSTIASRIQSFYRAAMYDSSGRRTDGQPLHPATPSPADMVNIIVNTGDTRCWILHDEPLAAQGDIAEVVYDVTRHQFICVATDAREELLDEIAVAPALRFERRPLRPGDDWQPLLHSRMWKASP